MQLVKIVSLTLLSLMLPLSLHGAEERKDTKPPQWLSIIEKIGANKATAKDLEDTVYRHEKLAIGIQAELRKERLELNRLLQNDPLDEISIMRQAESLGKAEVKYHKTHLHLLLELSKILSKEQLKKLRSLHWPKSDLSEEKPLP